MTIDTGNDVGAGMVDTGCNYFGTIVEGSETGEAIDSPTHSVCLSKGG